MDEAQSEAVTLVSVVIPAYNADRTIDQALESVLCQDWHSPIECVVVDDASTDQTMERARAWQQRFATHQFGRTLVVARHETNQGAGAARNSAIAAATSDWLCCLDADDVCSPDRVRLLVEAVESLESARSTLVGSRFERIPTSATQRYAAWANGLAQDRLYLERFREVTLLQPTWFFHRDLWRKAGGYDEDREMCDDYRFFHRHLDAGGKLFRLDVPLVLYRHTQGSLSTSTSRRVLVRWRVRAFATAVLAASDWQSFSVWGAGRDAKEFVNALCDLDPAHADRILGLFDVDPKKIAAKQYVSPRTGCTFKIYPISHLRPPIAVCVALHRTNGAFEACVDRVARDLKLVEGRNYWHLN